MSIHMYMIQMTWITFNKIIMKIIKHVIYLWNTSYGALVYLGFDAIKTLQDAPIVEVPSIYEKEYNSRFLEFNLEILITYIKHTKNDNFTSLLAMPTLISSLYMISHDQLKGDQHIRYHKINKNEVLHDLY